MKFAVFASLERTPVSEFILILQLDSDTFSSLIQNRIKCTIVLIPGEKNYDYRH